MKKLLALVLAVLFGVSCYAQSSSRVVYALSPNMNCENCAARVQSALQALAGVDSVKTCLGAQTVEVVYNGASLKPEVIVQALAGIGYTATPAEKCVRASAGQCANGVAVSKEAAQKMQRIEQANPGIVTAIDGKATVREAAHECTGTGCNEPNHQCSRQAVPAVKAVKAECATATPCAREADNVAVECEARPATAVKATATQELKKDAKTDTKRYSKPQKTNKRK